MIRQFEKYYSYCNFLRRMTVKRGDFGKRGDFDNNLDIARLHVVWATTRGGQ